MESKIDELIKSIDRLNSFSWGDIISLVALIGSWITIFILLKDKHNYRKYDNEQNLIEIVRGTSSPLDDVKELYLSEFEEARLEYNSKQSRPSRMIDNYFDNVSNNEKKDLACEIILELGDKEYWDTKDENFKKKMSEVYKKQVDDLELLVPNFKVASAIIHYDETNPHLHIVGIPIKYKR